MPSTRTLFLALTCVFLATISSAFGQRYPSRPVTIVVPFSAGGPTDTLARILAQRITVSLGQSVIIENVTGAAGSIGVGRVVRASADGYTLSIGNLGSHVLNGAFYSLQYDLLKDLEPIAMVASNPQLIVGRLGIPAKTLQDLVIWIKAHPGEVLVGTAGVGSVSHISGVHLQNIIAKPLVMVPFRGAGPALQAVVAGQLDLFLINLRILFHRFEAKRSRLMLSRQKLDWRLHLTSLQWMRPDFQDFMFRFGTVSGFRKELQRMSSLNSTRLSLMR
jgi:tripartite-type tricarboxylate transporter receptor subunit TctC